MKWKFDKKRFCTPDLMCNDNKAPYTKYIKCDIALKNRMIRIGDAKAKFKLVWVFGGPSYERANNSIFKDLFNNQVDNPHANHFYWTTYQNVEIIVVRQAQHTKVNQFKEIGNFDIEAGKLETKETLDTVDEIVKHFKDQGFVVGLYGISYGAFLLTEYLASYDFKIVDKIFIAHGRLDIKAFDFMELNGKKETETIRSNAIAMHKALTKEGFGQDFIENEIKRKSQMDTGLVGALNKNYLKILENKDLSNCIFINADGDASVGNLAKKEKDFIKNHNATLKHYSFKHVKKLLDDYQKEAGRIWNYRGYTSPGIAAHIFSWLTKESFVNNVLLPIGWSKTNDQNFQIDYYNGLKMD